MGRGRHRQGEPAGRILREQAIRATVPVAIVGAVSVGLAAGGAATAEHAPRMRPARAAHGQPATTRAADIRPAAVTVHALAPVPSTYTVVAGDSVSRIAGRYGLSTPAVLALNGLSWSSLIHPGQVLRLSAPAPAAAAPVPAAPAPAPSSTTYTIVRGDTVSAIAGRFGVTTAALLGANGLTWSSIIYPGHRLTIPGGELRLASAVTPAPSAPAPAAPAPAPAAPSTAPLVQLSPDAEANARTIIRVGRALGVPDQGIVVALAAAAQESSLRNLPSGDSDSVGLFQQRPSQGWGAPAALLDPDHAARLFYGGPSNPNAGRTRGLLDIPGWQSLSVAAAAQAVERSAYPSSYARWEAPARDWLARLG